MSDHFDVASAEQVSPQGITAAPLPVTTSTPTGAIINGRSYAPEELERLVALADVATGTGPLTSSVPVASDPDAREDPRFK